MSKLLKRYEFDWHRIQSEDSYHIEYSIIDICNKNCTACSHLAPLAKRSNYVKIDEFAKTATLISKVIPDVHTFWLTGGEPTLHPHYLSLLDILRELYPDKYIGIYSNGITLKKHEQDKSFWEHIKEKGIVWAITNYSTDPMYFTKLFDSNRCLNNLAIIQSGQMFTNLTNYSRDQPISEDKYKKCGWERSKINIRNGKIYNCPMAEFADLFNEYFDQNLIISRKDFLVINERLTRNQIEEFRGPTPFCGQCDLGNRFKKLFKNTKSNRLISEWSTL